MRSPIRWIGLAVFLAFSVFGLSCEEHHVGELPPEKPAEGTEHTSPATSPAAAVSPTPAEFFPTGTPR